MALRINDRQIRDQCYGLAKAVKAILCPCPVSRKLRHKHSVKTLEFRFSKYHGRIWIIGRCLAVQCSIATKFQNQLICQLAHSVTSRHIQFVQTSRQLNSAPEKRRGFCQFSANVGRQAKSFRIPNFDIDIQTSWKRMLKRLPSPGTSLTPHRSFVKMPQPI